MHSKPNYKPKVNVITLGCSKNTWDSEVLMGQLVANQVPVTHEQEVFKGDTVVINTCGFIDRAKQESIDTILEWADEKKKGNINKLIVMGCLSERYRAELQAEIPDVDAFFGTRELPEILAKLNIDYKYELVGERLLTNPSHYAYFKIAEGCDRPCSFCAIPLMRGQHVSFPIESLVSQAERLSANGTKELILIAQDLTYYGLDIYKERTLAKLIDSLAQVNGIEWIRLQYAYPSQFPMDILPIIREYQNVCKYIDMPLQHSTDNMLKIMRRGITTRRTEEVVDRIRTEVPGIAIRTTLLTGHPGETEEDHQHLLGFIQKHKFERLGVFQYSHEENTHAGTLNDDVPEEIKERRHDEIMEIQSSISMSHNLAKIGTSQRVLVDRVEGQYYIGRTQYDSPEVDNEVLIKMEIENPTQIGEFVQVRVLDAMEYDLFAEIEKVS
ncbi:MAG: 30S ribosomal protein S12 methylthiotransferase RimO [Bacteroidota bacterium]|nr:30S ribosomal protein S12 methylthiotransferase RimO [Bacteroidota bacterium]